jgi:acyl-CoA synthetase (AMP-forming)/AMP-acid ligase II
VIARATPRDHIEAPTSVGFPPSFVNVEIVDDFDRVLPTGTVGRVRVTSPGNASGYHGTSGRGERDEVFSGGCVYPGDLGRLDASGRLYLAGRASALIISGGQNVSPEEIEGVLQAHPAVAEAAVLGRPDTRLGEVPVALIRVRRPLRPGELEAHCRAQLQPHKIPVEFRVVDRLPKTPGGKVQRSALASQAGPRQ